MELLCFGLDKLDSFFLLFALFLLVFYSVGWIKLVRAAANMELVGACSGEYEK